MLERAYDKISRQTKPGPLGESGYEWVAPDPEAAPTPEERAEALAHFYDDPPPTRCPSCFNVDAYCTCGLINSRRAHPSAERAPMRAVPDFNNIDKILGSPEDRERMLREYAERGATELELLANDGE